MKDPLPPQADPRSTAWTASELFERASRLILIVLLAISAGRIASITSQDGETPFLSANDRSRWNTMAALLEDGTFAIDRFNEIRGTNGKTRTWYSIDMVRHRDASGEEHYYSSKPPLLTVLYTAAMAPVTWITGQNLTENPKLVGRLTIAVINLLPMLVFWLWVRRVAATRARSDWSAWLLYCTGLFATFLTTFVVTLNNHLHAAVLLAVSLALAERLLRRRYEPVAEAADPPRLTGMMFLLGIVSGAMVMAELPALAWAGMLPLALWDRRSWIRDWAAYAAGLIPVLAAIVLVNWYAHGDWRPPYYHREALGERIAIAPADAAMPPRDASEEQLAAVAADLDREELKQTLGIGGNLEVEVARRLDTLRLLADDASNPEIERRFAVVRQGDQWSIHQWNDWYDYAKSYWLPENKRGVDLGEPSQATYAIHSLIGHHGIFSLTPIFLLIFPGAYFALRGDAADRRIGIAVTIVSIVAIAFYLMRDQLDRNYGGVSSGFRWQFWLIPGWLWLISRYLAGDRPSLRSPIVRRLIELALAVSIFSAWYPVSRPWQHPWLFQWFGNP